MDKVADLLIRVKNGYMASNREVKTSFSKLNMSILDLLKKEGYIADFKPSDKEVVVVLRYDDRKPVLRDVKRVSKPGRRIYSGSRSLPRVLNGLGIAIISTPRGIMSDKQARSEGLGGEVMAYIW